MQSLSSMSQNMYSLIPIWRSFAGSDWSLEPRDIAKWWVSALVMLCQAFYCNSLQVLLVCESLWHRFCLKQVKHILLIICTPDISFFQGQGALSLLHWKVIWLYVGSQPQLPDSNSTPRMTTALLTVGVKSPCRILSQLSNHFWTAETC